MDKNLSYPFRVRRGQGSQRMVKIQANNYKNALNKVLALYPVKFIITKHARKMDLLSAKVEAAKESKAQKKKIYVVVDKDGECDISTQASKLPEGTLHVYLNGNEIKLTEEETTLEQPIKKVKTKKEKVMATTKTKKKSTTAKKSAPVKKVTAATKKVKVDGDRVPRGNNMFLTPGEWKKVDALLLKEGMTFSAWSRSLVQAKIK